MSDLSSIQLERHFLSGLIKHGNKVFPEIDAFISNETFFDKFHQICYSTIKSTCLKNESLDKGTIAQKIINLGITKNGEIPTFDYVDSLFYTPPNESATLESARELTKLFVLRQTSSKLKEIHNYIKNNKDKPLPEILSECDGKYNSQIKGLFAHQQEAVDIFGNLEETIEEIGNNPPDESKFMMGPFETINNLYGSLSRPGNITVIGARSGVAKTSLSMFYNVYVALKYNIPILGVDVGEMSEIELQARAVSMMTKGIVPVWAIENGDWRKNPDWLRLVREVWPIVKKIKFFYVQSAGLSPNETISKIRRVAYQKIGRGNQFLINYDYLKPFDTNDFNAAEWRVMGGFITDCKSFIQNELNVPFWCSLQLNKSGITNNKKANELVDNENSFSISDKIIQQSTHSFLIRQKVMEELADEGNNYGNLKCIPLKHRHLGKDVDGALQPVQIGKNKYNKNYVNLNVKSFYFEDKGDLRKMARELEEKYQLEENPPADSDSDASI